MKRLLFLIILILLSVSLLLNYVFYNKAFIPLHALRLDPIGLSYYPSTPNDKEFSTRKNTIMYYGDSRSLSWPAFESKQYSFVNYAIGNQTSIQILDRFDKHVAPYKPHIILVQMCVNDLKMIPLFPDKKVQIIKDCKKNIARLLQKTHKLKAKIILTTVFPLGDVSLARKMLGIKEQPIIHAIDEINSFIKSLKSENTVIFDSFNLLVGNNGKVKPAYSHDWLHLNKAGYKHLNQHLKILIKKNNLL